MTVDVELCEGRYSIPFDSGGPIRKLSIWPQNQSAVTVVLLTTVSLTV